eukprot:3380687-Rhodomonas_salina.1
MPKKPQSKDSEGKSKAPSKVKSDVDCSVQSNEWTVIDVVNNRDERQMKIDDLELTFRMMKKSEKALQSYEK